VAILLIGCDRTKVTEKHVNGKPKAIRTYTLFGAKTETHLKRLQTFYSNGNKEADTHYRHAKRHGPYLDYWQNGQKKSEGRFEAGNKEGEWVFYYNQFTVSARGHFKENLKVGRWHQYWENGDPKAEGNFHAGKEIDTLKEWNVKGEPMVENACFETNEHGSYRNFNPNKSIKEDYACHFGVPVGVYTRKDADGQVIEKGVFDEKGRKEGAWEVFNSDQGRASLKHYHQGLENDSSFAWDAAGRLSERGFFKDGQGERFHYDSLGHLIEKQYFAQSHPEGEAWVYYPTGVKRSLVVYKDGLPAELHKWHANGKLKGEGLYQAGLRTGQWKEYGENGMLLESSEYQAGILHGQHMFYDGHGKLTRTLRYEHGYPAEGKIPAALAADIYKSKPLDKPDSKKDSN
jgi:uncharacterized protein